MSKLKREELFIIYNKDYMKIWVWLEGKRLENILN